MTGDKYPSDWNKRRRTLFHRYNWECQDCGERIPPSNETQLHAHHVRPISEGGGHDLDNLLPLCRDCHVEIHASDMELDLKPSRRFECMHCGGVYIKEDGVGGCCSETCRRGETAESQLTHLHQVPNICSTCFTDFPKSAGACPNCDNWDPNEERRSELDCTDIDVKNLVKFVLKHSPDR